MLIKKIVLFSLALLFSINSFAATARFGASPDNSQQLLLDTIKSARSSLAINIYMITSTRLQAAIMDRMNNGVTVRMLVEGEPFGKKIVSIEKKILDELSDAFKKRGGKNRLILMTSRRDRIERRYVFDHAKYVVVDEATAYISSENFVNSGVMSDPDRKGNRGWQIAINDHALATELLRTFDLDTDTQKNIDVVDYDPSLVDVLPNLPPRPGTILPNEDFRRTIPATAIGEGNVDAVEFCNSPKSLHCMEKFIESAKQSLDVQHLSLPLYWPSSNTISRKMINPIVTALVEAARKKVKVRLLLQPSESKEEDGGGNGNVPPSIAPETISYLLDLAKKEKLSIQAIEIDTKEVQIKVLHNKGMIADSKAVFIGSINGTENSVNNNREVAVSIQSLDAGKYYQSLFDFDWKKSTTGMTE